MSKSWQWLIVVFMQSAPRHGRTAIWLALFIVLGAWLHAAEPGGRNQDLMVRVWGADEGMPSASVTSLAQTPEGYLWVGTLSSGLLRFDGVRFTDYSEDNTPELSTLRGVRRLMVDQVGRLWVSTYSHTLILWDHKGFQMVLANAERPEQLLWSSQDQVIFLDAGGKLLWGVRTDDGWSWQKFELPRSQAEPQVCADSDGRVWFLRSENEIWQWADGRTNILGLPPGLEHQRIHALVTDVQGRIWAGTDQMLAQWQKDHFVKMNPPSDEGPLSVKRIVPAGSSLWVEANGRMRRLSNRQWVAESEAWKRELGPAGRLSFLQGERNGGLWGSRADLGLVHVESDGTMIRLTTDDGLPSNVIRFAFNDREGDTWTGYDRGGLVQIHPRLFRAIGRPQGLAALVNSVCMDPGGTLWIGSHSGEVFRYQNGQCTNLMFPRGAGEGNSVVTADAAGRIWIATSTDGLVLYENGKPRVVADQKKLRRTVRLMLPARDGRLWIATGDIIWAVKDEELTKLYESPKVSQGSYYLAALGESADGTIWAGTFDGVLLRYDATRFERVEPPGFTQLGRLWSICPTPDGGLWIGTSKGGLLRYVNGTFRRYTIQDGLPSDCIVQVLVDTPGNLWLGTEAGIVRIAEAGLARFDRGEISSVPLSLYGKVDGLPTIGSAVEFQPNCWHGQNDELWFAMVGSVASVQPKEVRVNPIPPSVGIEEVWANGQRVWPARRGAVLFTSGASNGTPVFSQTAPFRLGPGRQDLEIVFAALSLDSPQGVRCRYQLTGLDTKWIGSTGERRVTYRGLAPGQYAFRLQACNRDGLWNENQAEIRLIVMPYFWQTAWFSPVMTLGLVMLVAAAVGMPLRARHRRRLAQLKRQRDVEQERVRVAHDLHDDLGAGLAQIGLIGALAQRLTNSPERMREHLQKITVRSRELVIALDEIVWAISPKHDSAASLSSYLCDYAQEFLRPAMISCRLDVAPNQPGSTLTSNQRHQIFLAFKEALTNAVRHAQATAVWIRIGSDEGELWVMVEDNGKGLPANAHGSGADGLVNMCERLSKMGGRCEIQNRPAGGTSVRFRLPIEAKSQL